MRFSGIGSIKESKDFILEELDNPKECQYMGRVDILIATWGLSFWGQYKKNFHFQVEVNRLEVVKSICAILGQLCAALVVEPQKGEMDSKSYKVKGLLLCLEKFTSIVQRPVRYNFN